MRRGQRGGASLAVLLEEVLIYFLDIHRFLDATADAVLDHEARELIAVYEYNSLVGLAQIAFGPMDTVGKGRLLA